MKTFRLGWLMLGWLVFAMGNLWGEQPDPPGAQAEGADSSADSSITFAPYANDFVTDPEGAKLHSDYIARMVEMGMPEQAYQQAQALVIYDSGNALAWAVIAFVDAKRGEMADAITEIVLAARSLPGNAFIQSTAGNLYAWYDVKGRGVALDFYTLQGMVEAGGELGTHAGFVQAYDAGRKAYESGGENTVTTDMPP